MRLNQPSGSKPRLLSDPADFSGCGDENLSSLLWLISQSELGPDLPVNPVFPESLGFKLISVSDNSTADDDDGSGESDLPVWFGNSELVLGVTGGGGPRDGVEAIPDPIRGFGGRLGGFWLICDCIKAAGMLSQLRASSELLQTLKEICVGNPFYFFVSDFCIQFFSANLTCLCPSPNTVREIYSRWPKIYGWMSPVPNWNYFTWWFQLKLLKSQSCFIFT